MMTLMLASSWNPFLVHDHLVKILELLPHDAMREALSQAHLHMHIIMMWTASFKAYNLRLLILHLESSNPMTITT